MFATRRDTALGKDNVRRSVFTPAVAAANDQLVDAGYAPLPDRLTMHALRHTYISLRVALGHDPATVSRDAGHSDIGVTFRIYTHVMDLDEAEREQLRTLVGHVEWAPTGPRRCGGSHEAARAPPQNDENPAGCGAFGKRAREDSNL